MMPEEGWKDLGYAALADAMRGNGCPLCAARDKALFGFFYSLLYEHSNDPETRGRIDEAGGFCPRHAWNLCDVSKGHSIIGGVPVANIYESLLRRELESLTANPPSERTIACLACKHEDDAESRYASKLSQLIEIMDFRRQWDQSPPLCLAHFFRVCRSAPHSERRAYFVEKQRRDLAGLIHELKEYLRKRNYLHADEPKGAEQNSWLRAIKVAAGLRFDGEADRTAAKRARE